MSIGIYKITNPTGKIYIGQSITIENRWKDYIRINKNIGPKIKYSLSKYNPNNHKFEIIEECTLEQLDEREIYWKQYYLEQNNNNWDKVLFCGLYDNGGGPMNDETKQKISLANKGKKRTYESKQKISLSKIGNKNMLGFKFSNESKQKISLAKTGKGNPKLHKYIYQYDLQDNFIKEWPSLTEAGNFLNINRNYISNVLGGACKSTGGFKFKYKEI